MTPPLSPADVIQSLLKSDLATHHETGRSRRPPVVTLSRDYGAGGEEIARRLAERLEVRLYDREILDAVAHEAGIDSDSMSRLDERLKGVRNAWLYAILSGELLYKDTYLHHLVNVLLAIAQTGGVIVGRGANVILSNRPVFRLRITGSEPACADRVASLEGLGSEEALEKIRRVNHERAEYLRRSLKRDINDTRHLDLVVNTDRMHDWDCICELVIATLRDCWLPPETIEAQSR